MFSDVTYAHAAVSGLDSLADAPALVSSED